MEWTDQALVTGVRRHGETSTILETMTRDHGRHLGLVRGGRSRAMQPVLQPGNTIDVVWRARLEDHLGAFTVEPVRSRASRLMERPASLHGLNYLCALLHLLPERDPHADLYAMGEALAEHLDDRRLAPDLMIRFELAILSDFGVGLDLAQCALSGVSTGLAYVSPKSGRAVCAEAGAPWRERLLLLPPFILQDAGTVVLTPTDFEAAFRLTSHFLERELFEPRGLATPDCRARFVADYASKAGVETAL